MCFSQIIFKASPFPVRSQCHSGMSTSPHPRGEGFYGMLYLSFHSPLLSKEGHWLPTEDAQEHSKPLRAIP